MNYRHFIDLTDYHYDQLRAILSLAREMKHDWRRGTAQTRYRGLLADHTLLMIFEKPSTRTRISFELAMRHLGGEVIVLDADNLQLGRGESLADTARVLSRYGDAVMIRANQHRTLTELAALGDIAIINGLTDHSHPCQILADLLTFEENFGPCEGRYFAYLGDGANNVARSWVQAAGIFRFSINFGCPDGYGPDAESVENARLAGATITVSDDPYAAATDANCIITDTYVSMGDQNGEQRIKSLRPYQVDRKIMAHAAENAIFLHCLPAHRGEEVSAEVIDGPASRVWDEAENRLHVQKAVLAWCLKKANTI